MTSSLALLCDVDGVLADTPHELAWKDALVELSLLKPSADFSTLYTTFGAGQPRTTAARSLITHLAGPAAATDEAIAELKTLKQQFVEYHIAEGRCKEYDDMYQIVREARAHGVPAGVVSSSENAEHVLKGMHHPEGTFYDMFVTHTLGVLPFWRDAPIERAHHLALAYGTLVRTLGNAPHVVLFDDAPSSISAGRQLGFCCVGVSRTSATGSHLASVRDLHHAGAHLAYTSEELAEKRYTGVMNDVQRVMNGTLEKRIA